MKLRFSQKFGTVALAAMLLGGCGLNDLMTLQKNSDTQQSESLHPLQMDVTFVANDAHGQPMTFESVHWFSVQAGTPVQPLPNGFRFTSQFSSDYASMNVSVFFNGFESCPIGFYAWIGEYNDGGTMDRMMSIQTTAFSQTEGRIVSSGAYSFAGSGQTFEACGTTFTVNFQSTELSH